MNNKMIDIEMIKQYVDISEEELMMRLVKDAVGLQEEAEKNKHKKEVKERLADPEYRKYVLMFWKEYDYLKQYFTDDEIIEAAAKFMPKFFLVTELAVPGRRPKDEPLGCGPSIFKRYGYTEFTECKGGWERKVRKEATFYTVADNYQIHSSDSVKYLLMNRFPYLNEYAKVEVYDIDDRNDWIYIGLPFTWAGENGVEKESIHSLYTPVSALMAKNPDKIVETHLSYWHRYNKIYDEREKAFVETEAVQEFLRRVANK